MAVPLAMGPTPAKGLMMVGFFALGLAITMTLYGAVLGAFGEALGFDAVSKYLFLIGSALAFTFGLQMLKVVNFRLPEKGLPSFVQKSGSVGTPLLMGLFLGNWGVGCPDPAFWVLLTWILGSGDALQSALLTATYSIGRSIPVIVLAVVATFGVSAIPALVKRRALVDRFFGFALIVTAGFLLSNVVAGDWFEQSWTHIGWNWLLHAIHPSLGELRGVFHTHPTSPFTDYGFAIWMGIIVVGVLATYLKGRLGGKSS